MTEIHGNKPTGYSYPAAAELRSAARSLARLIASKQDSRATYAREAKVDFQGFFAEVFERNVEIGQTSATKLSEALRQVASFVTELEQAAKEEDERREKAREWEERRLEREANWFVGTGYEIGTFLGFVEKDDPKPPKAKPAPQLKSGAVEVPGRSIPQPGGYSSVSSADPATLRTFQSGSNELDDQLATPISTFATALDDYSAKCNTKWGTLNAAELVTSLDRWTTANRKDAEWAGTIAALFESAGSGTGVVTLSDASISAALAAAGIDVFRDDFEIPEFSAMGTPPTNGFADDPVNTATGNFLEPETDVPFTGPAKALEFTRMYNSLDSRVGAFGPGWSSALDVRLEFTDEGAAFTTADGRQIHFPRSGSAWARGIGENFWLGAESHSGEGTPGPLQGDRLVVRDNAGGWWAFTTAGVWVGSGTGSGTVVSVHRCADGLVTRLAHEHGRAISIEYAGDRVAYAQVSDGRRVEYLYDADRRLIGVSDAVGTRRYRWNSAGLIDRVTAATGVVECENTYDAKGRVTEQLTPYGRTVRFAYLPGRVTSVSNVDGTNTNTWISDRKGRVVGIIDAEGHRQSMAYDPAGNLVSATERDGQVTVHAYDDRGRKTRTVTPEGADITYGYDELDRVTTVVTASGATVSYEYATEYDRNPSVVLDPLGGRTELTWEAGLLTHVTDPVGVTLALGYDEFGEQTSTRNAAGDIARIVRDAAGRVRETISPSGASTRYDYDEAGLLIARTDPDGGTWRFERGAGGRMTAQVDPLGARTEFEYGPHGHIVGTTDPLGRTISRSYDELENVESVTLADGAEWVFAHDALARLREITDPAGGTWSREYAPNGELTGTTDPTGVHVAFTQSRGSGMSRVQNAFAQEAVQRDEFGRPVRVEREDGSAELMTYDAAGNPVELLDADGGLTRIERDRAGRVTRVTTPAGRVTRYEYDACGRPVFSTDAAGGRTSLAYDADSRVVTRTSPAGDVTEIEYDAMGRIVREAVPGIGVGRYRYDAAGRLVFSHDWRTGIRRFGYDAAGQLTTATNGVGGVTRYEYDRRGRVTRIIDPAGGVTTRSYTELDRVASSTDPLGRTTTATYDGAGRQLSQTAPDGTTLEWVFDDAGLETEVRVDGRRLSHASRDARSRTVTITDDTRPQAPTTHTLRFTRNGQLAERVTVGADSVGADSVGAGAEPAARPAVTRWEYDADGARVALVSPDGATVEYTRDHAGRVSRVVHSAFGEISLTRDADGRLLEARTFAGVDPAGGPAGGRSVGPDAGPAVGQIQQWEYANGFPAAHTRVGADGGIAVTRIDRDEIGRITRIDGPDSVAEYAADDASQITALRIDGAAAASWEYDPAGRLVAETRDNQSLRYSYDAAGQLLSIEGSDGAITEYEYDGLGRRVTERSPEGATAYAWDARGWLTEITERGGAALRSTELWVDALGELADVDGARIHWDTASYAPAPISIGGHDVFAGPGGFTAAATGIDDGPGARGSWATSGWRTARAAADDPWATLAGFSAGTLPAGLSLTASGALQVAGLEWLGARAYDPAARGFLSVDPLEAPAGVGWAGNPYSYAGNDPLHAVDPLGLSPISDAELKAYADSQQGPLARAAGAVGHWFKENWEYVAAGAMIAGGIALMCTGVGGPVGMALVGAASGALVSGGFSVAAQKARTGEVSWGKVGVDAFVGAVGGGVSGAVAGGLAFGARALTLKVPLANGSQNLTGLAYTTMRSSAARNLISAGAGGSSANIAQYRLETKDPTPLGTLQAGLTGLATSAGGSLMALGGGQLSSRIGGEIADRLAGGVAGAVNQALTTGDSILSYDARWAGLQGLVESGSGPSSGIHARGI
ncbi:RHS repeat-associated protein [Leucobacter komagatae]|uniref:RHS repeat-associated protein n=1 Tax=Leucobacter komagatae TaxID=55969 RepID=A0A542XY57_9MICO|nr:DUF6531 domain-containing protein [Leucobacter komagatae]TQL40769.1 RHS repeat-associated protein [Leucobacter komagatae]